MKSPYRMHRRPTPPVQEELSREEVVDAQANQFLSLMQRAVDALESIDSALWVQAQMFADAFLPEEDGDEEESAEPSNDNSNENPTIVAQHDSMPTDFDDPEDDEDEPSWFDHDNHHNDPQH